MNPTSESSENIKKFAKDKPFSNLANHVEELIYAWKLTLLLADMSSQIKY